MIELENEDYGKKYEAMSRARLKELCDEYTDKIKTLNKLIESNDVELEVKLKAMRDALEMRIEQSWVIIADIKKRGDEKLLEEFLSDFYEYLIKQITYIRISGQILGDEKWSPKTPLPM